MGDHEFDKDPAKFMRRVADESQLDFRDWPGMCTTVAFNAAQLLGREHADTAYGLFSGQVAQKYIHYQEDKPLYRHGWVVLRDGRILDPTRWCFTHSPPKVGVAPWLSISDAADNDYHEGASLLRQTDSPPSWEFDTTYHTFTEERAVLGALALRLIPAAAKPKDPNATWPVMVTKRQLHWLCNVPPSTLGVEGAFALHGWLSRNKLLPFMPVDYQTIIRRWVRWA